MAPSSGKWSASATQTSATAWSRYTTGTRAYVVLKREEGALSVHREEIEALTPLLADWNAARNEYGLSDAVMIARDNATRVMLNEQARLFCRVRAPSLPRGVRVADQEFAVGDRVIARRNDRYRDVDNGTLGRVESIDGDTGAMTVVTDSGERRLLDANYVADHLEHAYALTGHGAHGATVEWAGVIGRPSEFTREWAYTSLSRARARTRIYVIAEATRAQREREQYAPPEPERTSRRSTRSPGAGDEASRGGAIGASTVGMPGPRRDQPLRTLLCAIERASRGRCGSRCDVHVLTDKAACHRARTVRS